MSGEEFKCQICNVNPRLQGGIVQEQGKKDFAIVCGLHLTENGKAVNTKDITGEWMVLTSWGYQGAVQPDIPGLPGEQDPLKYFDKVLERMQQLGQDDWGLKVSIRVGDVGLEGSTFPKGGGLRRSPQSNSKPKQSGPPVTLTNEVIFNGMKWKTKYQDETVPARIDSPWAWAFRAEQDGSQNDVQIALQEVVNQAGKKGAEIEGFIYTIGGRDGNLVNRKVKGGKQ